MAPTTSRGQLRRREAVWGGSRRRTRDPRDTNRIGGVAARASLHRPAKPDAIKDRCVNAAGVRGRLLVLLSEGSAGVPDAPPGWIRFGGFSWLHYDGLIWPHPRPTVYRAFG